MAERDPLADALYRVQRAYEEGLCEDVASVDLVDVIARAAREHIAAEIEAYAAARDRNAEWREGTDEAARIARGGTP